MNYRIGGEFELAYSDMLLPEDNSAGITLKKKNHLQLSTGRSAIFVALQDIIRRGGKKIAWIPRFCCESVIQPFKELGFGVNFYSLGPDLQSPERLPHGLEGVTFLYIHYFGQKNKPVSQWLQEQTQKNTIFVIEDCVQACLNENVGDQGDYVIYSYRKFLPQPDGAILASNMPLDYRLDRPDEEFISKKLLGKIIRGYGGSPSVFLDLLNSSEELIDRAITPQHMSWLSQFILARTDLPVISRKRVKNFTYLVNRLKAESLTDKYIDLLFEELDAGEVPLGLPIRIRDHRRDELRQFLMSNNVYCPIHWLIEDDLTWQDETRLSRSILTIPIDHRVQEPGLDYVIDKLNLFFER